MASYPTAIKSFTDINPGDATLSTQMNQAYDEIEAIETALGISLANVLIPGDNSGKTTADLGTVTTALFTLLNATEVGTSLISDTDATDSLGSAAVKWLEGFLNRITIEEGGDTTTPAAGDVALYAKADGLLYSKDDAGVETQVSGGGGSSDGWLAASGTWTYSSADAPTYVISVNADMTSEIGVGMKIKLTHATTKYFIVTAVGAYGAGVTLITVYGGTDYTLAAAGDAITDVYYSTARIPFGFPTSPEKWTEETTDSSDCYKTNPAANTWYGGASAWTSGNNISLSVPIGAWTLSYFVNGYAQESSTTVALINITLSDTNNSENVPTMSTVVSITTPSGSNIVPVISVSRSKNIEQTSKTTWYLLAKTTQAAQEDIRFRNSQGALSVKAVCAYL